MNAKEYRNRFAALQVEKQAAMKKIAPLEKQWADLRAKEQALHVKMKPVRAQMLEARQPIAEIDQEMAMISRALKGRTGAPEAA